MFGGNFAPQGWALCNGQLLSIQANAALFSILGTTYGGDGITNFALPNLQGRVPIHPGQGQGLSPYDLGQTGGNENVTLLQQQLPQHTHLMATLNGPAGSARPNGQLLAQSTQGAVYGPAPGDGSGLNASAITPTGGNQPHVNIEPYLCVNFIIALQGIYPTRN
jgi:microcystin-dependent protein